MDIGLVRVPAIFITGVGPPLLSEKAHIEVLDPEAAIVIAKACNQSSRAGLPLALAQNVLGRRREDLADTTGKNPSVVGIGPNQGQKNGVTQTGCSTERIGRNRSERWVRDDVVRTDAE